MILQFRTPKLPSNILRNKGDLPMKFNSIAQVLYTTNEDLSFIENAMIESLLSTEISFDTMNTTET